MLARTLFPVMLAAAVTVVALPAWAVPGDTLWTKTYDGPGSGVDAAGSVAWTARENGADDQGYVSDVGIGAGGVVFVTGRGTTRDRRSAR